MGIGTLEVQIFVSLAVILGTALIALIVDYLKGNNENLREHNIELRVRQQERDRGTQPVAGRRRVRVAVAGRQQVQYEETPAVVAAPAEAALAAQAPEPVVAALEAVAVPVFVENVAQSVEANAAHSIGSLLTQVIAVTPATVAPAIPQRVDPPVTVTTPLPEQVVEPIASIELPEPAPVAETLHASEATPALLESLEEAPTLATAAVVEAVPEPVVEIPQLTAVEEAHELVSEPSNIIFIKPVREPVEAPTRFRAMEFTEFFETPVEDAVTTPLDTDLIPAELHGSEAPVPVVADTVVLEPIAVLPLEPVAEPAAPAVEPESPAAVSYEMPVAARPVFFGPSRAAVLPIPPHSTIDEALPAHHWSRSTPVEPMWEMAAISEPTASAPIVEQPVPAAIADIVETREVAHLEPSKPQLFAAVEPSIRDLEIPVGLQSSDELERLVATPGVLNGVVIAIGINDYQQMQSSHSKPAFDELLRSVTNLVESIAGNKGMAARRSEDEFILIFPKDSGPLGQRRLTQISERLWDFQLRSLGSFSILFSWGAVEVAAEQLREAIDAANEQMYQTKRTRSGSFDSHGSRRRAVNL